MRGIYLSATHSREQMPRCLRKYHFYMEADSIEQEIQNIAMNFVMMQEEDKQAFLAFFHTIIGELPVTFCARCFDILLNNYFLGSPDVKELMLAIYESILWNNDDEHGLEYVSILIVDVDSLTKETLESILARWLKKPHSDKINRKWESVLDENYYFFSSNFLNQVDLSYRPDKKKDAKFLYNCQALFIVPYFLTRKGLLQPPVDALLACKALKQNGYTVNVLDLRVDKVPLDKCEFHCDYIFIAMCTYDMIQNYPVDYKFENTVSIINKLTQDNASFKVYAYGPYYQANAQAIRKICFPDAFIAGPIEDAVCAICDCNGEKLESTIDLIPDFSVVNLNNYYCEDEGRRYTPWSVILGNRGCPYQCTFCYKYFGRTYRKRSALSIMEELEILQNTYGVKKVFFLDSTFTLDKEWVMRFCEEYGKRNLTIEWQAETRIDCVSEDMIEMLILANCKKLFFGIETLNDRLLQDVSKKINKAAVINTVQTLKKMHMAYEFFLIAGLPGQSIEDLYEDYKYMKENNINHIQYITLTPRPCTELYESACTERPFLREDFRYLSTVRGRVKNNIRQWELEAFFDDIYNDKELSR